MQLDNVFVVGPDGTGKTEVAKRIAAGLGVSVFKCPSEKEMFKDKSFREHLSFDLMLPHLVRQTGLRFVSDRGYPCEFAYSSVFERQTDVDMLRRIDDLWAAMPNPPFHVFLRMSDWSRAREDDLVPREKLNAISLHYLNFYEKFSRCPYVDIQVDHFGDLWADQVAEIVLGLRHSDAVRGFRGIAR
jgi:hypothetical protein